MEKGLTLLEQIKETFACEEQDIRTYSPLTLAFLGDSVYDLIIRTMIVERGNKAANALHKSTSKLVKAEAQAKMIEGLMDSLTEQEVAIYKRGRNAKSYTSAKNASIGDYRKATGFEALVGYLYLQSNMERILELVKAGIEFVQE